jgi:hypothetical protein
VTVDGPLDQVQSVEARQAVDTLVDPAGDGSPALVAEQLADQERNLAAGHDAGTDGPPQPAQRGAGETPGAAAPGQALSGFGGV